MNILTRQSQKLETLSEAWRLRAEEVAKEKVIAEGEVIAHEVRFFNDFFELSIEIEFESVSSARPATPNDDLSVVCYRRH